MQPASSVRTFSSKRDDANRVYPFTLPFCFTNVMFQIVLQRLTTLCNEHFMTRQWIFSCDATQTWCTLWDWIFFSVRMLSKKRRYPKHDPHYREKCDRGDCNGEENEYASSLWSAKHLPRQILYRLKGIALV